MNKKGFTLIELLAVIIILGLIAVITIPKLNKQLDQSKKSLAEDSALKYKKSIDEYVLRQEMNKNKIALEGTYNIDENGYLYNEENTHKIPFSGTKPTNGTLQYINDELQSGCITINKYKVTFTNGEISNTENGTCEFIKIPTKKEILISLADLYIEELNKINISASGIYNVSDINNQIENIENKPTEGWIKIEYIDAEKINILEYSLKFNKGIITYDGTNKENTNTLAPVPEI